MRLIIALAAGALGYFYCKGRSLKTTKATVKEDLHRWEGEGGNVPNVATPSPAAPAYTPSASPGVAARH